MENDVLFDIEMAVKLVFDKIGILQEHKQYDNVLGKRWNARFRFFFCWIQLLK